jgi:cytoskeletal protein CcmA (bactofilin family)
MFTRKSDTNQVFATARAEATDAVVAPVYTSRPMETPMALSEPRSNGGVFAQNASDESIIGPDLKITGNVICRGRVRLEGIIEGDMRCASLVVGQEGAVTGGIVAEEVAVYGRVAGTIRGRRVNLYATAHVEGDITHQGIGIEMGTHYDGRLRWSSNALDEQAQLPSQNEWPASDFPSNGTG